MRLCWHGHCYDIVVMEYTIIDPGNGYELHKAGCRDLARLGKRADIMSTFEADSVAGFLDAYFDGELRDMGYSPDDCRVFPCCRGEA